jgi:hypothetical protein
MHARCLNFDIQMMYIHIIFYRMLPPRVEIYKVFEPHFGISFDSFKVRVIVGFSVIRAARIVVVVFCTSQRSSHGALNR